MPDGRILILPMILAVAACNGATGNTALISSSDTVKTSLLFINEDDNPSKTAKSEERNRLISADPVFPKARGFDGGKELAISKACTQGVPPPDRLEFFAAAAPVIAFVAKAAIDYVLEQIEKEVAEELKKYSKQYPATGRTSDFYRTVSPRAAANYRCLRLVRGKGPTEAHLDVVMQMRITGRGTALQIRPMRVYFAKSAAEKGEKFGVAIALKAQSTWMEGNAGKTAAVFEQDVFSGKFDLSDPGKDRVVYPAFGKDGKLLDNWDKYPLQPLPSWSKPNRAGKTGNVTMTATVAEVGEPPKLLTKFQEVFAKNKGQIGDLLKKATDELIKEK
ncbi:MAG: hypothetical protein QNJ94_22830 [Alphaproteobacteria bacterium]|nr:hypothetical protein [Alphaproteobacteria bacterium]